MRLTVILAILCCLTACAGSETPTVPETPTATPAALTMFPAEPGEAGEFQETACHFQLPEGIRAGQEVTCGFLNVPELRTFEQRTNGQNISARIIQLHVAVFHPPGGAKHADAVIFLSGGPGFGMLEKMKFGYDMLAEPVHASGRDLVVFDQRGVGLSHPALDCPEFNELALDLLDSEVDGREVNPTEKITLLEDSLHRCRDELSLVADLSAYHSAASAADVEDLRLALGYTQVNLWGSSYGSRLALEVMRRFPQGLRSVVLDAVYPPDADLYVEAPANFSRALEKMFAACEANPVCQKDFPDLRRVFFDTVERLDANPVMRPIENFAIGEKTNAILDGEVLLGLTFQLLYDSTWRYALPKQIYAASQGDYSDFDLARSLLLNQISASSRGMMFSVQCNEEEPFSDVARFRAETERYAELSSMYTNSLLGDLVYRICPTWGAGKADESANQAVTSNIPTLVMSGEFDPITPPEWGRQVVETLSNAHSVLYPGVGHGASTQTGCPRQMLLAFWEDPTNAPDDACLAEMAK